MPTILDAIESLARGDWESAHVVAQGDDSAIGSWLHGIVHLMEGDLENARYWYRRASRPFPDPSSIDDEIQALKAGLDDG
jgi:hypothetical protein